MRFTWIALVISILIYTPLVGGCGNAKKEAPPDDGMVTPPKNKNPKDAKHPRFPEPPP
jgi:hypothetical protein